ncbi:hypothetical protein [Tunturiibacter gelidiferens]|uniref:hypothetical protein n=1 Tax=Tunturiibacter gelidiferens TaxID=3069689 RepID=UPI003D9ABCE5
MRSRLLQLCVAIRQLVEDIFVSADGGSSRRVPAMTEFARVDGVGFGVRGEGGAVF